MRSEDLYHRQLDIVPPAKLQKAKVTVIGCGAVGSFTAFTLAKMGIGKLTVYDDDTVAAHNLPNQLFSLADLGKPKVSALAELVRRFHGVEVEAYLERYENQRLSGIVIAAVDSMDARINIWRSIRYNALVPLFIDSRMGAEVGRVISLNPCDPDEVRRYEDTLHTSAEALPARCTEKTIIYTVLGLAGCLCGKVKKYLVQQPFHKDLLLDFRQSLTVVAH